MGIFEHFRPKKPLATNEPIPSTLPQVTYSPKPADTTAIEQEHFWLQLPFEWRAIAPNQPLEFEFRNQKLPEQLLVTVLLAQTPATSAQMAEIAERLLVKRRDSLMRLSEGKATLAFPTHQTKFGHLDVRCSATIEPQNIEHAWVTRVTPAKVVTAALTRYTRANLGVPFATYAGTLLFDRMEVRQPGIAAL